MANKKIWLGMAAALLLAFSSVLVSCGGSCSSNGDCKVKPSTGAGIECDSSDCAAVKAGSSDSDSDVAVSCDC